MKARVPFILPLLLFSAAAACAGRSAATSAGGTGTSGGSGTSVGAGTAGTTGVTGTTGGDVCAQWFDDPQTDPQPLAVRLRNDTADVVYLPRLPYCSTIPHPFEIHALDQAPDGFWPPPGCDNTCEQRMENGCIFCGPCPIGPMIRLEPAGVYTGTWDRRIFVPSMPPAECFPDGSCPDGPCNVNRNAWPGAYRATGLFLVQPQICQDDPAACTCTPNADGWCETMAVGDGEPPVTVEVEFDLPAADVVDVPYTGAP